MKRPSGPRDSAGVSRLLDEAGAHYAAGQLAEAARAYDRAERAAPSDFRATYSLAVIDLARGQPDRAIPRLRRVVSRRPELFEAWHNLGSACQTLERWADAADAYRAALALRPDAHETRRNLAVVLVILGRLDAALSEYASLAAAPETRLWAISRIGLLRPGAIDDASLADMSRAAADPACDLDTRIGLVFALGEVLERRGRDDEAFAAFSEGNRLKRARLVASGVDPAALLASHAEAVATTRRRFTPDFIDARRARGLAEPAPILSAPIFIVGAPRSGSTLIEQILAAHPRIQAMGETGALPRLLESGQMLEDAPDLRAIGKSYLKALRGRGWRETARPVDKTLENYLHVGAIALLFPRAVILHAVRDPVDTCLSCYRQLFSEGAETLYDLAEIGAEYALYRRMMDHWTQVLPGRVVEVDHEALVADPEQRIPWLVTEACGLPWNDACLRFHDAAGPVRTASAAQVRQPIFTTSLQRWRRYEPHLAALLKALDHPLHGEGKTTRSVGAVGMPDA